MRDWTSEPATTRHNGNRSKSAHSAERQNGDHWRQSVGSISLAFSLPPWMIRWEVSRKVNRHHDKRSYKDKQYQIWKITTTESKSDINFAGGYVASLPSVLAHAQNRWAEPFPLIRRRPSYLFTTSTKRSFSLSSPALLRLLWFVLSRPLPDLDLSCLHVYTKQRTITQRIVFETVYCSYC